MRILPIVLLALAFDAPAQLTTAFPEGSETLTAESFGQRFAGRSVQGTRADGQSFRMDFAQDGGYRELGHNIPTSGKWRFEDGKLCTELVSGSSGCNEVRAQGEVLYYKRLRNGEVLTLKPR